VSVLKSMGPGHNPELTRINGNCIQRLLRPCDCRAQFSNGEIRNLLTTIANRAMRSSRSHWFMFRVDGRQTAPYAWGGIPMIRQGPCDGLEKPCHKPTQYRLPGWMRHAQFIAVNRERLAPGNNLISTADLYRCDSSSDEESISPQRFNAAVRPGRRDQRILP
jgi:hypothetical protein